MSRDERPATEGQRLIVVVDGENGWGTAPVEEHALAVLAPEAASADEIARLDPARIVVNLASAGALDALVALRESGCTARVWGCVADSVAGRALPLGMLEPTPRPLDPDAVLAVLGPYAGRGTRVVTVGADVDALVSLRQALARQGMSVSMAWDAKQATDLLAMVRPDVVVVDLEPRDGCGIVGRLGGCEPVPTAVLIAPSADPAGAFAAILLDASQAHRAIAPDRLLARVVAQKIPPPTTRR